jgi:hypothetical protein
VPIAAFENQLFRALVPLEAGDLETAARCLSRAARPPVRRIAQFVNRRPAANA